MERGLDQLIFFAFIVLAALVDWVVRVIRNRNAPPRPPVDDAEVAYFADEAEYPEQEVEVRPAPAPPPREVVFDAPVPAEWRRVVDVRRVPEQERGEVFMMPEVRMPPHVLPPQTSPSRTAPPQRPAQRTASSRRAGTGAHRWRHEALGIKAPGAARRAIVMMAVLGPCRALEDQAPW